MQVSDRDYLSEGFMAPLTATSKDPTAASMTNYLAPVVAVLLGVAFVEERLSAESRS